MNPEEKLIEINEISRLVWDWLCENPIVSLIPAIEKIIELSNIEVEK